MYAAEAESLLGRNEAALELLTGIDDVSDVDRSAYWVNCSVTHLKLGNVLEAKKAASKSTEIVSNDRMKGSRERELVYFASCRPAIC